MPRDLKLYIYDILDSIIKVQKYVNGIDFSNFNDNEMIQDAVIRNLEIVGEAVKNLPFELKKKYEY